jgi:asparagine synthase (glutamine-hydrolysing)
MCGIAGIQRSQGLSDSDRHTLRLMLGALIHRGPDEEGMYFSKTVAMGTRRLSIIDLAGGQQPMYANGGDIAAVANAEIYNHKDLRASLIEGGAQFRSRCDVEVIPQLYARDGLNLAASLNGQFAFAVHDSTADRLVLGRDQIGIAPLYWTRIHGGIAFASEIKALLAHPEVPRCLDLAGLDQVLTYPGLVSPTTMFRGVHALRPGHIMVIDPKGMREQCYWNADFPLHSDLGPDDSTSEAMLLDELDAALQAAVSRRLVADVPVGLYVSGGLDSALIAALAHQAAPDVQRHSFSITFNQPEIDERNWQAMVTQSIGSDHHSVEFAEDDVLTHLREIVRAGECALKESYNTCTLVLARLVQQQGLRVVLTGEGADELFGGYVGYRLDETRALSDPMAEFDDLEEMLEKETRARLWGDETFFYERDYGANADLTAALLAPRLLAQRSEFSAIAAPVVDLAQLDGRHPFHKRSYLDMKLRLADHLLQDHSDRVAYAASVEARYPFLDPQVIDVARRIPPSLMVKNGEEKHMLKQLGARHLPAELVARRKFSFVAQGSPQLLRTRQDWIMDLLAPERIAKRGIFNPDTVAHLRRQYENDAFDISQTFEDDYLMIVLTTELLMEEFQLTAP